MDELILQIANVAFTTIISVFALVISIKAYKITKQHQRLQELKQKPILYTDKLVFGKKDYQELNTEVTLGETNYFKYSECLSLEVRNIGDTIINGIDIKEVSVNIGTEQELNEGAARPFLSKKDFGLNDNNIVFFTLLGEEKNKVIVNFVINDDMEILNELSNIDFIFLVLKLDLLSINSLYPVCGKIRIQRVAS